MIFNIPIIQQTNQNMGEEHWKNVETHLRALDHALDDDVKIKIGDKQIVMNKGIIESAFGRDFNSMVFETPENTTISVYKRTCHFCHSNVTRSKHCKNELGWHFCNECFKSKADMREHIFKIGAAIPPFSTPKCIKSKCSDCAQHKEWRKKYSRSEANNNAQHGSGSESDEEESAEFTKSKSEDENQNILDLLSDNSESEEKDEDISNISIETPRPKKRKRRLVRRSDASDSESE